MKRPARAPSQLSESLGQRLNAYALAASAAGVATVALTQAAQAKVVYTKAFLHVDHTHAVTLDLTNNGKANFLLAVKSNFSSYSFNEEIGVGPYGGHRNAVALVKHNPSNVWSAVALHSGAKIGPNRLWGRDFAALGAAYPGGGSFGKFHPPHQHYIGLRFIINGETHYGWARFSGIRHHDSDKGLRVWGDVTGYAYETIPNRPIIAGKTKGPDEVEKHDPSSDTSLTNPIPDNRQPASLGALAMGAPGMSIWRRKEWAF